MKSGLIARIHSLDAVRGLVMLIMALDHVRDLIHIESLTGNPTDMATTTPILFLTRWITHLCAPTFVFLSGTSAYLSFQKAGGTTASRKFLITRGIWLLLLEFTIVNFGIWFDVQFSIFLFQVIAAIGLGFIVLGLMLKSSAKTIGIIGLTIICTHNLFPFLPFADDSSIKAVLAPLFAPGLIPLTSSTSLLIGYPPIPWVAILFVGFWCGRLFTLSQSDRKRIFGVIGASCVVLFCVVRYVNVYGDTQPWATQKDALFSFFSFINVSKYPPSLLYDLLMLGLMFLLLTAAERMAGKTMTKIVGIYGQVPLFYYLLHWYIIHPILFVVLFAQGYTFDDFEFGFNFGRPKDTSGLPLWGVYLVWLGVILALYPICRWYGGYKLRHRENKWLRYF